MKRNKRRCRADGDNVQLTFNVDTSLPFVMKSSTTFQNLTRHDPQQNTKLDSFNIPDYPTMLLYEAENKNSLVYESDECFKKNSQNFTNSMNAQNEYYLPNQTYFTQSSARDDSHQILEQHGYLTSEQKQYLKYKNSKQYHENIKVGLESRQKLQTENSESNIYQVEEELKILPKITFLNHFIKKILARLFRKELQSKEDVSNTETKFNSINFQHTQLIKITKRAPIIFEQLHLRPQPKSERYHRRNERKYKEYKIMYQIDEILDTCETLEKKRGSFDSGQINPNKARTQQFLVNCVLEKCSGVKKHIVQDIEIIENQSIVLIKMCCIVKGIRISNNVQCTFLNLCKNVVTGLRLYTPHVQISFNQPVCLDKVEFEKHFEVNNYSIKMKENMDKNINILFSNLQVNINSLPQFIAFFKINCRELSQNFVDYLYVSYLSIGAVSL